VLPAPGPSPVGEGDASEIRDLQDADALGRQFVRFTRVLWRVKARFVQQAGDGIEQAGYALLAYLVTEGPRRTTALAEAMHSDVSTISRQVGALCRIGLVERRADPQDGRACLLAATASGERTFQRYRRLRNEHTARLLAGWPREDVHQLVRLFDRLNTDLERHEAETAGQAAEPARRGGEA
jgi:DNA-binding MarR family transcriptional regulator